jgi:hypothetical protein
MKEISNLMHVAKTPTYCMYLPTTRISLFISLTNSMKNRLDVKLTGFIWSAYTETEIIDLYSKDISLNSVSVF